jgi:hypothetical protein
MVEQIEGVEAVWGEEEKRANRLDHPRSGELVAIAKPGRWFSYYWWFDDERAPDYARTVDIHRKPGYDPVELFFDPDLRAPKLASALKLMRRKIGFRGLMDVISCSRTELVKGTHGRLPDRPEEGPLVISSDPELMPGGAVRAVDFKALVLAHVFGAEPPGGTSGRGGARGVAGVGASVPPSGSAPAEEGDGPDVP